MVVAEMLDLSRLPSPDLIAIDYEADLIERIARLKEVFDAAGISYDVDRLLTDPAGLIQEADNYRETLAKATINDTYKKTLIGFAERDSLDWFAANFHFMGRMDGETDERFRRRIQLENENKAGGRLAGYMLECMNASIEVSDVGAWVDRSNIFEPTVRLAIMVASVPSWVRDPAAPVDTARFLRSDGGGNGAAPDALVTLVQSHMDRDTVKQATDIVAVQSVSVLETDIRYMVHHLKGPDPTLLRTTSGLAVARMVDERHKPHRDLPRPAIIAAGSVGGVETLSVDAPATDIDASFGELVFVNSITVESAYTDG